MIKRLLMALVLLLVVLPLSALFWLVSSSRGVLDQVVVDVQTLEQRPRDRPSHVSPPAAGTFEACVKPLFTAHAGERTPDECSKWVREGLLGEEPAACATWRAGLGEWPNQVVACSRVKTSPHPCSWADSPGVLPVTALNALVLNARAGQATLENCADALAFARDRHRGSGTLGLAVASTMVKRLTPACVALLDAAPVEQKWKFAQAVDTLLEGLPALSVDLRDEWAVFRLSMGGGIDPSLPGRVPERWRANVDSTFATSAPLAPFLTRLALLDWRKAFPRLIAAADLPVADRDREFTAVFTPLTQHWNPMMQAPDWTKWGVWHDEERALLVLLSRAAMLDALGPQGKAPDLSKVQTTLKVEQKDGSWHLSAAGVDVSLHPDPVAP